MPEPIGKALKTVKYRALKAMHFVSPAPAIEGIPASEQEQSLCRLIALKLRRARGEKLSFEDAKKLDLSDAGNFPKNAYLLELGKLEIDEGVRGLAHAINSKKYLCTQGACSGHLTENELGPFFSDSGFISFIVDKADDRSRAFVDAVKRFCEESSAGDTECRYETSSVGDRRWTVKWRWNNEVYDRENALIHWDDGDMDPAERERQLEEIQNEKDDLGPLAKELNIHGRQMAFVQRLTEFINGFEV